MDSAVGGSAAPVKDLVSIVVPVRSEAGNIPRLFEALCQAVHVPCEILVICDSDDDPTIPEVRALTPRVPFPVRLVQNLLGPGPANALRSGFTSARGDAVVVVMADLSDEVTLIDRMVDAFSIGYDLVCPSRYMAGGQLIGGPWLKGWLSRLAGVTLHYLVGLPTHDPTNSFKLYRTESLRALPVESSRGFEISLEITVKGWLRGWRIAELPARWTERTEGRSKFRLWRWLPAYARWYIYALLAAVRTSRHLRSRRTGV